MRRPRSGRKQGRPPPPQRLRPQRRLCLQGRLWQWRQQRQRRRRLCLASLPLRPAGRSGPCPRCCCCRRRRRCCCRTASRPPAAGRLAAAARRRCNRARGAPGRPPVFPSKCTTKTISPPPCLAAPRGGMYPYIRASQPRGDTPSRAAAPISASAPAPRAARAPMRPLHKRVCHGAARARAAAPRPRSAAPFKPDSVASVFQLHPYYKTRGCPRKTSDSLSPHKPSVREPPSALPRVPGLHFLSTPLAQTPPALAPPPRRLPRTAAAPFIQVVACPARQLLCANSQLKNQFQAPCPQTKAGSPFVCRLVGPSVPRKRAACPRAASAALVANRSSKLLLLRTAGA